MLIILERKIEIKRGFIVFVNAEFPQGTEFYPNQATATLSFKNMIPNENNSHGSSVIKDIATKRIRGMTSTDCHPDSFFFNGSLNGSYKYFICIRQE